MTNETVSTQVAALDFPSEGIVVAVDETPAGTQAVHWAARDATLRGRPLRLLHALDRAFSSPVEAYEEAAAAALATVTAETETMLARHEAAVRAEYPQVEVATAVVRGLAGDVLVEASRYAALLVLGGRVHGRMETFLVGSVADHVASRAHCPVVVVRAEPATQDGPVVIGVDDSDTAQGALALAYDEAALRGAPLEVVSSRPFDLIPSADALREQLAPWSSSHPDVQTRVSVVEDPPGRALLDRSHTAQLLVVGTHGRGRLGSLVIGSVSRRLLREALCPVAVVRPHHAS